MRVAVVGAGGFAREVEWLLRDLAEAGGDFEFVGYLVSDVAKLGPHDERAQVLGDFSWLQEHRAEVDGLALGIGTPAVRLKLSAQLTTAFPELKWPPLVHPSVRFDRGSCRVGRGVTLCAGSIATVHVDFGDFCMVNLSCTIGHEAKLGAGVVLNPTVNISGGVVLGDGVLVGTGAQVLQYLQVGAGATVGAGSVVTRGVDAGVTVVGAPARPLVNK